MYSDLEYLEFFKQDFYNAQEEIIVFASSMDESLVKDFSLNVQKLIELGVRVSVVTCNNALQRHQDAALKERDFNDELEFKVVGSTEANTVKGKISDESPVGRAISGRKVGEVVEVETQEGIIKYEILEIQKSM